MRNRSMARRALAAALLISTAVAAVTTATARADAPSPSPSADSGDTALALLPAVQDLDVPLINGTTVTCKMTQSGAQGAVAVTKVGYMQESARVTTTTSCNKTLIPSVKSYVWVENINPAHDTTASGSKAGSGYGPVTATASQQVLTAFYGPRLKFTFESISVSNTGYVARICRYLVTDDTLTGQQLKNC